MTLKTICTLILFGALFGCGSGTYGPKENETLYSFNAELLLRGIRGHGVVTEAPAIAKARYSYVCINDFNGEPAEKRAQASHERLMSNQYAARSRMIFQTLGRQTQDSILRKFSEPILAPFGCRFFNRSRNLENNIVTTDARTVAIWGFTHGLGGR